MFSGLPRDPVNLLVRVLLCSVLFLSCLNFCSLFSKPLWLTFQDATTVSSVHLCSTHQCSGSLAVSNSFCSHTHDIRTLQKANIYRAIDYFFRLNSVKTNY